LLVILLAVGERVVVVGDTDVEVVDSEVVMVVAIETVVVVVVNFGGCGVGTQPGIKVIKNIERNMINILPGEFSESISYSIKFYII